MASPFLTSVDTSAGLSKMLAPLSTQSPSSIEYSSLTNCTSQTAVQPSTHDQQWQKPSSRRHGKRMVLQRSLAEAAHFQVTSATVYRPCMPHVHALGCLLVEPGLVDTASQPENEKTARRERETSGPKGNCQPIFISRHVRSHSYM